LWTFDPVMVIDLILMIGIAFLSSFYFFWILIEVFFFACDLSFSFSFFLSGFLEILSAIWGWWHTHHS
jgi:hypothetical protein